MPGEVAGAGQDRQADYLDILYTAAEDWIARIAKIQANEQPNVTDTKTCRAGNSHSRRQTQWFRRT